MQSTFIRWLMMILMVSGGIVVVAQDDDTSEPLVGEAFINTVTVESTEDSIQLAITGDFPDNCTELGDISQSVDDNTIAVTVETLTPADTVCAQVLTPFEITYDLDISELDNGTYTVDVNGVMAELELDDEEDILTCPEADEETVLFDDNGICFLYPSDFDVLAGRDFIFISQPMTGNAVLLISFEDADEITLEDLQADIDDDLSVETITLGGTEALVIETDTNREAIAIANDSLYQLNVQPLAEDNFSDDLWTLLIETIFFPASATDAESE